VKRRLLIALAILLLPLLLVTWLTTTESGLHWLYQRAEAYLPVALEMEQLSGQLTGPITITGLHWQQDGVRVQARQLTLDWRPAALLGTSIHIDRLQVQGLELELPEGASRQAPPQAFNPPTLHLPWRMHLEGVQLDDIQLRQGTRSLQLQQVRLDASTLLSRIDINTLAIRGDGFSLDISGDLRARGRYAHDLDTRWQAQLPSGQLLKGQGSFSGDLQKTRVKQRLSEALQLSLEGTLRDLTGDLRWQAQVDVSAFDTARLVSDWPALAGTLKARGEGDLHTASVSGTLQASHQQTGPLSAEFRLQRQADNQLQIDQLTLRASRSDTRLDASGSWQAGDDGGQLALKLDWQNLRWPITATPQADNWFSSARGKGSIEGTLQAYRIELTTDSPWPQLPPSSWYARAQGNLNGMHFDELRISALDGEALVNGQLDWSPQLSWQAEASLKGIDPASLWPAWPGRLDARLTSRGGISQGQLFGDADISRLSGRLRGQPVSLSSHLGWQNNGLDIHRLNARSGTARVSASGRLGDTLDLDWRIAADNLAHLYPQATGRLQASGQLTGPRQTPRINATINAQALGLQDSHVGSIDGRLLIDLAAWQQFDIRLAATALKFGDQTLQSLDINGNSEQLQLSAAREAETASLQLRGDASGDGWQGHVQRATFNSRSFGNWQLNRPAALSIEPQRLQLQALCWRNEQQAELCASLQRDNHDWQSRLQIKRLPLLLLGPWLPPDVQLEGVADGRAELHLQAPDRLSGDLQLSLPAGAISYPLLQGERGRWQYREGSLSLKADEQGAFGKVRLAMRNGDQLNLEVALPAAQLLSLNPEQQPLRASAQLRIHDLALIQALLPEVQKLQGEIGVELSAGGTLAQPRLDGQVHLLKGSLQVPRLGLQVDQLSLLGYMNNSRILKLEMTARSGDGTLTLKGQTQLDPQAGWPTRISIQGDNFEAASIPEARVLISPDLQLRLQHRDINISGTVHIPYAKLQPRDITTATRVSDDAVIVGGEQAEEAKWAITTRIRLTLGERVNFYGFGFEGRLGGNLLLEDTPGQLTSATGEITIVEGRYRAYGQRLDVENGRLLYTGGPLANPGLDLRAVRQVNNVTAGIHVRGSLNQPKLELFSIPAMGETDTLSYLVLGRPMETASGEEGALMAKAALALGLSGGDRLARLLGDRFGLDEVRVESSESGDQASLVMGRYLSPKLYVSYGVGLIEAINTFTVRYQISDKWQLKAESGEAQGADLLYTIER
jgi:translocation and assembly module TamB